MFLYKTKVFFFVFKIIKYNLAHDNVLFNLQHLPYFIKNKVLNHKLFNTSFNKF